MGGGSLLPGLNNPGGGGRGGAVFCFFGAKWYSTQRSGQGGHLDTGSAEVRHVLIHYSFKADDLITDGGGVCEGRAGSKPRTGSEELNVPPRGILRVAPSRTMWKIHQCPERKTENSTRNGSQMQPGTEHNRLQTLGAQHRRLSTPFDSQDLTL